MYVVWTTGRRFFLNFLEEKRRYLSAFCLPALLPTIILHWSGLNWLSLQKNEATVWKVGLLLFWKRLGEGCVWKKKSSFRLHPVTPSVCPCLLSVPLCKVDYHKALIRITECRVYFFIAMSLHTYFSWIGPNLISRVFKLWFESESLEAVQ